MTKNSLCLLTTVAFVSMAYAASAAEETDTAITIYSKAGPGAVDPNLYRPVNGGQPAYYGTSVPGYAIVRQQREVNLDKRESLIKFSDVASLIDPTTVQFKSLTDPKGTKVAEQNYQFDLVSQQKLLEKYIDKKISIERMNGDKLETIEGTLLSTMGGLTIKTPEGQIKAVNSYNSISFPELPGGLITKPTLVWDIFTDKPGKHKSEVSYETQGVTWWADYNLTFHEGKDANSGTVDFGSWVSIINQTGASYEDAKLKLVAGDVEKAQPQGYANGGMMKAMRMEVADAAAPAAPPSFAEKSFFEYHLYTLSRPVTLPDNSTKQMELIPAASNVPVEKLMVFNATEPQYWNWGGVYYDQNYGLTSEKRKIDVILKLKNSKENGIGEPLPAGRMRVSQRDDDGSLEFIGENVIDHTPRNEEITIKLGNAFDVVGERKQLKFHVDTNAHSIDEEIEIKLRNQKKQKVEVKTIESLYRATNWKIVESDVEYKQDNAHQISFVTSIEPEQEQVIRYHVHYSW